MHQCICMHGVVWSASVNSRMGMKHVVSSVDIHMNGKLDAFEGYMYKGHTNNVG